MVTFLAADIVERLLTMLWPMARISALLLIAPVLSLDAVTVRIRIVFAFVLTVFIYPLFDWPVIDPTTAPGLLELANQITIGILMGLILQATRLPRREEAPGVSSLVLWAAKRISAKRRKMRPRMGPEYSGALRPEFARD